MRRRALLQRILNALVALVPGRSIAFGQIGRFTLQQRRVLFEIASLSLPSKLGNSGAEAVVAKFEDYVRGYHAGADTDHGYGFTHVIPKPPSPVMRYAAQLSALSSPVTRGAIEHALREAEVKDLPLVPDGKSVISDLMSFYFRSSEANDLCYSAAIGRDQCRGLAGSDQPPKPLRRFST